MRNCEGGNRAVGFFFPPSQFRIQRSIAVREVDAGSCISYNSSVEVGCICKHNAIGFGFTQASSQSPFPSDWAKHGPDRRKGRSRDGPARVGSDRYSGRRGPDGRACEDTRPSGGRRGPDGRAFEDTRPSGGRHAGAHLPLAGLKRVREGTWFGERRRIGWDDRRAERSTVPAAAK